jgi:hypothetical protein
MQNKKSIIKKAAFVGGWQLFNRSVRMVPFGGTIFVLALLAVDIRKKGMFRGAVNSGIDALPFVGFAKNAVEIFTGDFIPDRSVRSIK